MNNIKFIIGVVSCKGGVGKSTIAINLAVAFSFLLNKKVGLLDADIYGPNHSRLLGISDNEFSCISKSDKFFTPIFKHGLFSMSFGYFLDSKSAVLLRGPVVSNTIKYLFTNTLWGDLDVLVVDFPPGTGDIYLSLLRDISFTGIVLVTTPHVVSIDDVRKSIFMLKKFNINICCIIENMKYLSCEKCSHINYIYGANDFVKNLAYEFDIKDIYCLELSNLVNMSANIGIPFLLDSQCPNAFKNLFLTIVKKLL